VAELGRESQGGGFEEQCRRVQPKLLAYVRRCGRTRRYEDPEDVCQEVLLEWWQRSSGGMEVRSPLGFARRLAHDRSVDSWRRRELQIVEVPELDALEGDRSEPGPEAQVAEREEATHIAEVVEEKLGVRERGVCVLRSAGFKESEIASRLGLSERQVGRALDQARAKLRPACEVLAERGRCRMLALAIEDLACGRIGPESPRWASAQRHLASCPWCPKRLVMIKESVAAQCGGR